MLKIDVYNQEGEKISQEKLDPSVFGVPLKEGLVHEAVVVQMAKARRIIAHTKTRGEVRGGGVKPWRQKGTGRARHGSIRSPLWRGGGVTFGPTKTRNFDKKINKKAKRKALLMCLSDKVANNLLIVLDKLLLGEIKTKKMLAIIENLKLKIKKDFDQGMLIILAERDERLIKSVQNIPKVETINAASLNVIDLVKYNYLLTTLEGLRKIEKIYRPFTK